MTKTALNVSLRDLNWNSVESVVYLSIYFVPFITGHRDPILWPEFVISDKKKNNVGHDQMTKKNIN